jgi:hypothetical protein
MLKAEPMAVNETAIEGPFDEDLEFGEGEHRNGRLPALPDVAFGLWLQFNEGVAEKSAYHIAIEFPTQHQHVRWTPIVRQPEPSFKV